MTKLEIPCSYQGGKQRLAKEIIDIILEENKVNDKTIFYDICCGSGAITIELINRGIKPEQIVMCDKSSWGVFWKAIGEGTFDIKAFNVYSKAVPRDYAQVQEYIVNLSKLDASIDEVYKYLILQATSFGGKQIWRENKEWKNASFRSYWQPTEKSNRRSPVTPMHPNIDEIEKRVEKIVNKCKGLKCIADDAEKVLGIIQKDNCIIYLDPPYTGTTKYGFTLDYIGYVKKIRNITYCPIYVSEKEQLSNVKDSRKLNFSSSKGGISGNRKNKHEEWLNKY